MGSTFSNISIKKNKKDYSKDEIKSYLVELMNAKGYKLVNSNSKKNIMFSVKINSDSSWITFYSDEFDGDLELTSDFGTQFSEIFKSPALCFYCNDSDFLLMNLVDSKKEINTIAYVGHQYEEIPLPSIDYDLWEPYFISKQMKSKFRDICESDYVFAEDALIPIGELLGFKYKNVNIPFNQLEDSNITYKFYFSKSNALTVDNEPVNIKIRSYSYYPAFIDQPRFVSYLNHGGTSKGLAIYLIGDYVKDDLITFSPVELGYHNYKSKKYRDEIIRIPLELKKRQLNDGTFAYYVECPEFEIPEKVDSNLSNMKHFNEEILRSFFVRFIPRGNGKHILDITVIVFPMQRVDNQVGWNVWRNSFESKEACIDYYNKRQEESRTNSMNEIILMDKDYYLK